MGEHNLKIRALVVMALMTTILVSGCAMSQRSAVSTAVPGQTPAVLKTASKAELIDQYNALADSVESLNASVTIQLTSGSNYSGVIEQYHEITGFILAQKPADIRVIGQVPIVGKNIFDMESDGNTFHIFVPSKNQFLVGPANLERASAKPIENLRPQHLLDAIFWQPIPRSSPVLIEETTVNPASFYVLTVVEGAAPANWRISRKIWFERTDLNMIRIDLFDQDGTPISLIRYANWDMFGAVRYPKQILLNRTLNDYQLEIQVTKLTPNEPVAPDRFVLDQPEGSQLVRVGQNSSKPEPQKSDSGDPKPADPKRTELRN